MNRYLAASDIINWDNPLVMEKAKTLSQGLHHPATISKACFEYVREIKHSNDYRLNPVTQNRYCYANSHLLAALLRANGIPAGFYYTRFSSDTIP